MSPAVVDAGSDRSLPLVALSTLRCTGQWTVGTRLKSENHVTAEKSSQALNELTAAEIAHAVKAGTTTHEAVARACLERIALLEPEVGANDFLNPEQVIGHARTRARSRRLEPNWSALGAVTLDPQRDCPITTSINNRSLKFSA